MLAILAEEKVEFGFYDILGDSEVCHALHHITSHHITSHHYRQVREGLKAYSQWPTYPQLYVKGELVGGLDIIKVRQHVWHKCHFMHA